MVVYRAFSRNNPALAPAQRREDRAAASVHKSLIDQRLEHLAVICADRARRLGQVDAHDLFLGIDPEIGAGISRPHEFASGTWHTRDPVALTHREAETECVALRSEQ